MPCKTDLLWLSRAPDGNWSLKRRSREASRPLEILYLFGFACTILAAGGCSLPEVAPRRPEQPAGPLSLDAAVELALRNNPDVLAAEDRVAEGRAAIDEAYSHYWPVLQLVERFTQTDAPSQAFASILDQRRFESTLDFNDPGVTPNFRTGLTGSITIYDGGRRRARAMEASARAKASEARQEEVRRDLALEVARSYYLIHEARETASAQESSISTLEAHLRIAGARVAEGAARRSEVLAVQVRLAETREGAISARNSARRAEAGLLILLGLGVEARVDLLPPPIEPPAPAVKLEDLLPRARRHRFEIVEAVEDARAAQAKVKDAAAGYFPEITVFGNFGFDDRDPSLGHANWTWGVTFLESLFDALRAPHRMRQAVAGFSAALAALQGAVLKVELDLKNAILDGEEADARHAVAAEAVTLAEESLRLVEAEYREGAATVTRLLDAELALTRARTRLSSASYGRALSRIATAHAAGEYPAPPAEEAQPSKERSGT